MSQGELLEELRKAVVEGDPDQATMWAKRVVENNVNPVEALERGLSEGLKSVGDAFGRGELFLCDLIMSAEAMKQASVVLEEEIKKRGLRRRTMAKFAIGTVAGDIHDIGKAIVAALFTASGFDVVDLGTDVSTEGFIKAVEEQEPHILGLSALLTVTAEEQPKVIEALKRKGLRNKVAVMVGGGAVTRHYAEEIEADGYGEDSEEAVRVAMELLDTR